MVDTPENIGLVRGMLGLRLWNKHDDNDQSNTIAYTRSDLVAELAAENERLTKALITAGRKLSNCAYNISQGNGVSERERIFLREAQHEWDAALKAAMEAGR